jgi:hypothetical protein
MAMAVAMAIKKQGRELRAPFFYLTSNLGLTTTTNYEHDYRVSFSNFQFSILNFQFSMLPSSGFSPSSSNSVLTSPTKALSVSVWACSDL